MRGEGEGGRERGERERGRERRYGEVPACPAGAAIPPESRGGRGFCSEQSHALSQSVFPRISLICTFLFLCDVTIALSQMGYEDIWSCYCCDLSKMNRGKG